MKKITIFTLILLILTTACKKETIGPNDRLPVVTKTDDKINGGVGKFGTFLIIKSRKMVTVNSTNDKIYYDDFGQTDTSSLRWGGSIYEIENIVKDKTTWSFYRPKGMDGKFVINNDTTKYYNVHYTNSFTTIVEDPNHNQSNIGGSSRPITGKTIDLINKIIIINIQEQPMVINNKNCRVFTELTLKKIEEF